MLGVSLACIGTPACNVVLGIDDLPPLRRDAGADVASSTDACADGGCRCPPRLSDSLHVSPNGSDDPRAANGSEACPFKTITNAIANVRDVSASTIVLHHVGDPASYGDDCTGGPPCDAMPIVVPSSIHYGLTITGDGNVGDVFVIGASGFDVHGGGVGFAFLTIEPTQVAVAGTTIVGGTGIVYEADAPHTPASSIHDVEIDGATPTAGGTLLGTGSGLAFLGEATPTVGPAVTIQRGLHGIAHQGQGELVVAGTADAPVRIVYTVADCIAVSGGAANAPTISMSHVELSRCSSFVAGSAITIDTTAPGAKTSTAADLTVGDGPANLTAIYVSGASSLRVQRATIGGAAAGVIVSTSGSVDLEGVNVTVDGDGVRCNRGDLRLRGSTTLGCAGSGVVVAAACVADLGTSTDPGDNVFDTTSKPNGGAGLCMLGASSLSLSGATFGCGWTSTTCGEGTPTRATDVTAGTCAHADVSLTSGAMLDLRDVKCCD